MQQIRYRHVLFWQSVIAVALAAVCFLAFGRQAGISAALAGICCVVPNSVFLGGLHLFETVLDRPLPASILVMELIKIVISVGMMVAVFWFYRDISWIAFLLTFILVLKSYILLLLKLKR